MTLQDLPTVNAVLNASAALLLAAGYAAVRTGRERLHRALMLSAAFCSLVFLVSYLVYHAQIGSKHYPGTGSLRIAYLTLLLVHTVLAAVNVPLVATTLVLALRGDRARHRKWARRTFPVWMTVSLTGIAVYLMLYVYPPAS